MHNKKTNSNPIRSIFFFFTLFTLFLVTFFAGLSSLVSADIASVSQLGFHPFSEKKVIFYTDSTSGSFTVNDVVNQDIVFTGSLETPRSFSGEPVACQGGIPCLVGFFTSFETPGTYTVTLFPDTDETHSEATGTLESFETPVFSISSTVFHETRSTFAEFFDAMKQQDSSYHADFNSGFEPQLTIIADGSFIMKADQAALTTIRLGSAYRLNPSYFTSELHETILDYVDYLVSLQGVIIEQNSDGIRLNSNVEILNAFTPGPINDSSLVQLEASGDYTIDVYIPGNPPTFLRNTPVHSLCAPLLSSANNESEDSNETDSGSSSTFSSYEACVDEAASFYRCEEHEVCLNMSYVDARGRISEERNGFAVSNGWQYDFGCYLDVLVDEPQFTSSPNPCLIFESDSTAGNTVTTLLAFAQAYPAVSNYDTVRGNLLLERIISTESYIKNHYSSLSPEEHAFYGAALFLLFDYTDEIDYLERAYAQRDLVPATIISTGTTGAEFYWQEYIAHEDDLDQAQLSYSFNGEDPREIFRGKLFFDYKDRGFTSLSNNGERVFQFDPNIQFQNSRFMLTEGVLALKTLLQDPDIEYFAKDIADSQIAWLTGMNAVQDGVSLESNLRSYSFIFGIGEQPSQYHSRYLVNSGYREASANLETDQVIGLRGTNFQFFDESEEEYYYFDGRTAIFDTVLGSQGNEWNGETPTIVFADSITFSNGKHFIDGWINGAFDVTTNPSETDVIFNYDDTLNTYEFTETTNEMVATAIEYMALADYYYSALDSNPFPSDGTGGSVASNVTEANSTITNSTDNSTQTNENNSTNSSSNETILSQEIFSASTNLTFGTFPFSAGRYELREGQTAAFFVTADTTFLEWRRNDQTIAFTTGTTNHRYTWKPSDTFVESSSSSSSPSDTQYTDITLTALTSDDSYSWNISVLDTSLFENTTDSNTSDTNQSSGAGSSDGNSTGNSSNSTLGNSTNSTNTSPANSNQTNSTNSTVPSTTGSSSATITGHGTSLQNVEGFYQLPETEIATFSVTTNATAAVRWLKDGVLITVTEGKNDSLTHEWNWTPGILFTSNEDTVVISAETSGNSSSSYSWDVSVFNVINPFWDGAFGSSSAQVHVFTDNDFVNFSFLTVRVSNSNGASVSALSPFITEKNETDWSVSLSQLPPGTSFITQITGYDTLSEQNLSYTLTTERGHFRSFPENNDDSSSGSSSSGGGGFSGSGGFVRSDPPTVVYARFTNDVIPLDDLQTLQIDAKNFNGGIQGVEAVLLLPDGSEDVFDLTRIEGSAEYGTWQVSFSFPLRGSYALDRVVLETPQGSVTSEDFAVSFYNGGDLQNENSWLEVIDTVLSESQVDQGTAIVLTAYLRDAEGIVSAHAEISNNRGNRTTLPLTLVEGDATYGTWQVTLPTSRGDATYTLESLYLENPSSSASREVQERQYYVIRGENSLSPKSPSLATGFAFAGLDTGFTLESFRKNPLFPTLFGVSLIVFLSGLFFVSRKLRTTAPPEVTNSE